MAYTGLGDAVSGWTYFWGLRAYSAAFGTGNLIRVRRSSDNTEMDIAALASGALDSATAITFAGAGNLFITTFYEQVSGVKHLVQATAGQQAQLLFTGGTSGTLPWAKFVRASNQYYQVAISSIAQPHTFSIVTIRTGTFTLYADPISTYTSGGTVIQFSNSPANNWDLYAGGSPAQISVSNSVWHCCQAVFNGSSSIANIDGTETTGLNPGSAASGTKIAMGNDPDNPFGQAIDGGVVEMAVHSTGLSGGNRTAARNNQDAYWLNPPTGSVASAAGTSTATGVGAPIAASTGAAAGIGAAAGVGARTAAAVGSAGGTSTAAAVGSALAPAVGASAGVGTATAVGAATMAGVGASAGVGTAAATGASTAASVGAAAGLATASAAAASVAAAAGAASGLGAAAGVSTSLAASAGAAAGVGAASGIGRSFAASVAAAAGSSAASGIAFVADTGTGTASGTSTAAAIGRATAASYGAATGQGSAAAVGTGIVSGVGSSSSGGAGTVRRGFRPTFPTWLFQ